MFEISSTEFQLIDCNRLTFLKDSLVMIQYNSKYKSFICNEGHRPIIQNIDNDV